MAQLPDLSSLALGDGSEVALDTGSVMQGSGVRKPTSRKQRRAELARLVADEPYEEEEGEDEDWVVPDDLQSLDRSDAARGRVAPRRRAPKVAEEVRSKQGEAGRLFRTIQDHVRGMWNGMRQWYWCEPESVQGEERSRIAENHADVAKRIIDKYALDDASWTRYGYASMRGMIHDTILPESTFRTFFDEYIALRGGMHVLSDSSTTPAGHFTQVQWEVSNKVQVAERLAVHAQLLSPLLDAIREFGFAPEDKVQFQVLWRFLPVRHNNSSTWHMDSNDFMLYGDESMEHAALWTNTGKRSVVTVSCLHIDPSQPTDQCGTRVLSGLPMLTERAVKGAVDDMWAERDSLLSYKCAHDKEFFSVRFNRVIRQQTESAIAKYTAFPDMHDYTRTFEDRVRHEKRVEELLASAGVQIVRTANGEIGTFNDHAFHASSTIPPNHVRVFLVLRGEILNHQGKELPFRKDAEIVDRHGRRAELSFQPI